MTRKRNYYVNKEVSQNLKEKQNTSRKLLKNFFKKDLGKNDSLTYNRCSKL